MYMATPVSNEVMWQTQLHELNQAGLFLGLSTILLSLSCSLGVSPSYSMTVSTVAALSGPPSIDAI